MTERRLAAILAADIVGFSKMMGDDEAGTLARLQTMRADLFDLEIAKHNGRIVKLMGDGTLVEFPSVVDAVTCAVAVQEALDARNRNLPDAQKLELRIGINLGDVIIDDEDIYGDGVNVAARLEGLARPGGVVLSQAVVEQVAQKTPFEFEDLGTQQLKNIAEPVHVWRLATEDAPAPARGLSRRPILIAAVVLLIGISAWWTWQSVPIDAMSDGPPLPDKPSIAVLPFQDLSEDPKQWFGDGMAEDIITDLSKLSGLFVIARNSSFQYRGGDQDMRAIGRKLGVAYLLEGSVRRAGDTLRINAQLIDAQTGGHVWADRFDGAAGDVFALQDKVTGQIVQSMELALTATERNALLEPRERNPEAYDAYLKARDHLHKRTRMDLASAKKNIDIALSIDPEYPEALAVKASILLKAAQRGWMDAVGSTDNTFIPAIRATKEALQHPSAFAHAVAAEMLMDRPDPVAARREIDLGLALNPNDPDLHLLKAILDAAAGDYPSAVDEIDKAFRRDPNRPAYLLALAGEVHHIAGKLELAMELYDEAIGKNPENWGYFVDRAAAAIRLGRTDVGAADLKVVKENWYQDYGMDDRFTAPVLAWWWGRAGGQAHVQAMREAFASAGVPMAPKGYKLPPENRLSAEEIKRIKPGKTLRGQGWSVDNNEDFEQVLYWNDRPVSTRREIVNPDGSTRIVADDRFRPDEYCDVYRNPDGSDETLNSYYAVCNHGVFPYGMFPLEDR